MTEKLPPQCVGFIMDGNRRWAKEQGQASFFGHQAGEKVFYDSVAWVRDAGIAHAVYYAFSTENWQRSETEVTFLMQLFESFLSKVLTEVNELKVRVRVIGRREDFSPVIQSLIAELEAVSQPYTECCIWVALSYGGRAELLSAINEVVKTGQSVNEESFKSKLWTAKLPDPDLIIRTGGEKRLSNFLPWQSIYSELFFIDTYWPAFTKVEFTSILAQYGDRQRRHGV